jgi:hypothetical protein
MDTMTDVNERIAKALGWEHGQDYGPPLDYEHSIDASMAVIRSKWPYACIDMDADYLGMWVEGWGDDDGRFDTTDGDTDAARLANALLAALEAEA